MRPGKNRSEHPPSRHNPPPASSRSDDRFNLVMGLVCAVLATISLAIGGLVHEAKLQAVKSPWSRWGLYIVGFWLIFPPVFFWLDWCYFRRHLPAEAREELKETHDLSRNIWIALVIILSLLFGLTFPLPG